jgi:hypothetical protein
LECMDSKDWLVAADCSGIRIGTGSRIRTKNP